MTGSPVVPDEPTWTDRFADDVQAALQDEHRPRWPNGKPCSSHRLDDCCATCCTTCYLAEVLEDRNDAESPVVPAATDEAPHYCCDAPVHPHWGSVVPAATDDEAATEVIALALKPAFHEPLATVVAKASAEYVVAALRSAGFRIVHDNTEAPR